jgi:hypothetical protein
MTRRTHRQGIGGFDLQEHSMADSPDRIGDILRRRLRLRRRVSGNQCVVLACRSVIICERIHTAVRAWSRNAELIAAIAE